MAYELHPTNVPFTKRPDDAEMRTKWNDIEGKWKILLLLRQHAHFIHSIRSTACTYTLE